MTQPDSAPAPRWLGDISLLARLVLGVGFLVATTSHAEPLQTTDGEVVESPAPRPRPLAVLVQLDGYALDPIEVRIAVSKELGVSVTDDPAAAGAVVEITATHGKDLVVVLRSQDHAPMMRAVDAPELAEDVPEAAALLVGNLARDEAGALLEALAPNDAAAARLSSEAPPPPVAAEPEPEPEPEVPATEDEQSKPGADVIRRRSFLANVSLFHPLTIIPDTEQNKFQLEVGLLYSRIYELDGAAFNAVVMRTDGPSTGAQFAGAASFHRGIARGAYFTGAYAQYDQGLAGASFAGAANVVDGSFTGVQVGGAVSLRLEPEPPDASTTENTPEEEQPVRGAQIAGAVNLNQSALDGMQLAGGVNVNEGDMAGVQIAGATNVADDIDGVQIAVVNIGGRVKGLQLGVVNVAEEVDGASIGLVTYSEKGRTQAVTWYSTHSPMNVGVRFYSGVLYAMPTFGFDPRPEEPTIAPGFSLGARIPIQRAFVDIDANYSNPSEPSSFDEHNIDLRYRALVGFEVTRWFSVFAGGGVRHHFRTMGANEESFDPELTVGVQFF